MRYALRLFAKGAGILLSGFVLGTAPGAAESQTAKAEEAEKAPPLFGWSLLWTGSWEEGKTLNNRGDLRLLVPRFDLSLRAQALDRRPLNFSSGQVFEDFSQGLSSYGGGLYHRSTGSRLLYGVLEEGGLSARIRNPWIRALPYAENHAPLAADLKTAITSTGKPETYLYAGSPRLNFFPSGPGGGIGIRAFASAQLDRQSPPGFGGGLEALLGEKAELRLDGFYTGKTLSPRQSSTWFSEKPPLPERDFRLSALGLLLDTPVLTLSSDWAYSETFAWGRDCYGNLGLRFARSLPAGWGRWALSLAADGAGSRFTGRDGSSPGGGFRSGAKFEWYGQRSSLLRIQTSLRSPALGGHFNQSASSLSWRLPVPGKNSGAFFRLNRFSLEADRNASDPEKILDTLKLGLGFTAYPRVFGAAAAPGLQKLLGTPVGFSFSASLKGLSTAAEGRAAPYPPAQTPYRFEAAGAGGEISWSPGIFQFRAKLGYEAARSKAGLWEISATAAIRLKPGRLSVKILSPAFPGGWNCTVSWRLEKK
jgi:hypothetical protein